jgi:hypothetical protein
MGGGSTDGKDENQYKILLGKTEGKIPFGRPRSRWKDIIKMDLN